MSFRQKMPNPIDLAQGSQLNARSPYALGIEAASFASEALAKRAKIERKARRRSEAEPERPN